MSRPGYVAFDLGAESGRAMLAMLDGERVTVEELHRFANLPLRLPSGYHWNLLELWSNLLKGLGICAAEAGKRDIELLSLGVDTWGVDYGLIGQSGQLLGLPFAYRDERNPPAMREAFSKLGEKKIYKATGIQFMPFNTLFQLVAQYNTESALITQADRLLMMPDLLHYFFSGEAVNEATDASTTQMINPRTGKWAKQLLKGLGLPTQFLGDIVPAGTPIGMVRQVLADELNVPRLKVIAPGAHDTASAVAAVPVDTAGSPPWAYLSSGTWSLMGAELDEPVINEQTLRLNFTNERGVNNKILLLKNLAGLWLVQEVRRDLARNGQEYDYQALTDLAEQAPPFRTLVDPGHGPFASPGDMLNKIRAFAQAGNQPVPETPGQFVRCCLESLALIYRETVEKLQQLLGKKLQVLHIVGGGGRNQLLNQMAADALNRPVIVGPYEATAVGNALTQAMGAGQVQDLNHLRAIVRQSFEPVRYQPRNAPAFEDQVKRFTALLGK